MKKEYLITLIIGLLVLTYVLDKVAHPLSIPLASPYHYFDTTVMFLYPFTTTSIALKSLALIIALPLILSSLGLNNVIKGITLITLSAFMQLYALQLVFTNSRQIPLEWSLSLTLSGVILLIPAVLYMIFGGAQKVTKKLADPYASDGGDEDKDSED